MLKYNDYNIEPLYLPNFLYTGYNVRCTLWGVAKRKGSGLWIRHRWFESIHPSQHFFDRVGNDNAFSMFYCVLYKIYVFDERSRSHAA